MKKNIFYGDYNVDKTCVGAISTNPKRGFPWYLSLRWSAGVRPSKYTTTWHASINSAATFNRDLVYEIGKAQDGECKEKGINVMLTPCIKIMKHPKGAKIIEGMQSAVYGLC